MQIMLFQDSFLWVFYHKDLPTEYNFCIVQIACKRNFGFLRFVIIGSKQLSFSNRNGTFCCQRRRKANIVCFKRGEAGDSALDIFRSIINSWFLKYEDRIIRRNQAEYFKLSAQVSFFYPDIHADISLIRICSET